MNIKTVVIIVPARDEQELVGRCLRALERARDVATDVLPSLRIRTVVVADRCRDDTVGIADRFPEVEVVSIEAGNVGAARVTGIDLALDGTDVSSAWIANTDADSQVPPNWLLTQLEFAYDGADVVVGTVRPRFGDLTGRQIRDWLETHTRGVPNGHVHGANLGVRATAYLDAGGFEPLEEHEDADLVGRLSRFGFRIASTDRGEVITSGRLVGRTPGGYAAYLAGRLPA